MVTNPIKSPCSVNVEGTDTIPNKYSWNDKANVIFLDQVRKTYVMYAFLFIILAFECRFFIW